MHAMAQKCNKTTFMKHFHKQINLQLKNSFTLYKTLLITVQETETLKKFGNNGWPEVKWKLTY